MATATTTVSVTNLVINKVTSIEAFQQMQSAGLIQANELYLVEDTLPALTIGSHVYNGTTAVTINVYDGTYTQS